MKERMSKKYENYIQTFLAQFAQEQWTALNSYRFDAKKPGHIIADIAEINYAHGVVGVYYTYDSSLTNVKDLRDENNIPRSRIQITKNGSLIGPTIDYTHDSIYARFTMRDGRGMKKSILEMKCRNSREIGIHNEPLSPSELAAALLTLDKKCI